MRTRKLSLYRVAAVLAVATLGATGNAASAAEYWIRAAATSVTMPDPGGGPAIPVPMWGYATCTANFASCPTPAPGDWTPGPALTVPPGDTTLTVHLRNDLSVPTSLVIHGLVKPMAPVWTDGTSGPRGNSLTKRVRSFDAEAAPGGAQTYEWGPTTTNPSATAVPPGTYLYQSGTQPQVQVQMGLYGAVTKNFADATPAPTPAQAYSGVPYDNQATLLYSEIDPALHVAVGGASPTYGTPAGPTSTFNYSPKYFLVNGQPFPFGTPVIPMAASGTSGATLLRFLNAGLMTHVPMIMGTHLEIVAEDGKPYPQRRNQYSALLPAAKTLDAVLRPEGGGVSYAIFDRRLSLSNAGVSNGGLMAVLRYDATVVNGGGTGPANQPPIAGADSYDSIIGVALNVSALSGVLGNDSDPDGGPLPVRAVAANGASACGGTYALNTNGSFVYTPPAAMPVPTMGCTATSDSFSYQITDGQALSLAAPVTINLTTPTPPNPITTLDNFDRANTLSGATGLGPDWSQAVATTTPEPNLRISANQAIASATDLGGLAVRIKDVAIGDGGVLGAKQYASFTMSGSLENSALVLKATGPDTKAPVNYIRVRFEGGNIVVYTVAGGSNTSVYVKQATFAAAFNTGNMTAVVDDKGRVTVFQGAAFIGGVQLPDVAVWKGTGRIGIQLQTMGTIVDDFGGGSL